MDHLVLVGERLRRTLPADAAWRTLAEQASALGRFVAFRPREAEVLLGQLLLASAALVEVLREALELGGVAMQTLRLVLLAAEEEVVEALGFVFPRQA